MKVKVMIDPGHGITCPNGSPDKSIKEYALAREISSEVVAQLLAKGCDVSLVTPEVASISINTRVARVNKMCHLYGKENVIVISIHADAKGNGKKWHEDAKGWSVLVANTASAGSRRLAECLFREAEKIGRNMRTPSRDRLYWERDDLGILKRTLCPAVLTENFFMTNHDDCAFLLTAEAKKAIAKAHVDGIIKYLGL